MSDKELYEQLAERMFNQGEQKYAAVGRIKFGRLLLGAYVPDGVVEGVYVLGIDKHDHVPLCSVSSCIDILHEAIERVLKFSRYTDPIKFLRDLDMVGERMGVNRL